MENYFLLLDLPYCPAENNEKAIEARIEEKKRFWTSNANHFQDGAMYRKYLQLLPEIRRVMLDFELRQQEARQAESIVSEKLDQYFSIIVTGKTVSEAEISLIEKKTGFGRKIILERMKKYGYTVGEREENPWMEIYQREYERKPLQAEKYQLMDHKLKSFDADDFYEFLGIHSRSRKLVSEAELCEKANQLKKNRFCKNDEESGNGRQLCASCCLAFQTKEARNQYDEYCEWKKKHQILDQAKEIAELKNQNLTQQQSAMFISRLEEVVNNRKRAEQIFSAFCRVSQIFYDLPSEYTGNVNVKRTENIYENVSERIASTQREDKEREEYQPNWENKEENHIGMTVGIIVAVLSLAIGIYIYNNKEEQSISDNNVKISGSIAGSENDFIEEDNIAENEWDNESDYQESDQNDNYQEETIEEESDYYEEEYYEEESDYYGEEYYEEESDYEYILVDSDSRYIKKSELKGLSRWELRIARNEIYARHGRKFYDEELQDYFDSCSWYDGDIEPDDFKESILNKYEISNRDEILKYEKKKGYY